MLNPPFLTGKIVASQKMKCKTLKDSVIEIPHISDDSCASGSLNTNRNMINTNPLTHMKHSKYFTSTQQVRPFSQIDNIETRNFSKLETQPSNESKNTYKLSKDYSSITLHQYFNSVVIQIIDGSETVRKLVILESELIVYQANTNKVLFSMQFSDLNYRIIVDDDIFIISNVEKGKKLTFLIPNKKIMSHLTQLRKKSITGALNKRYMFASDIEKEGECCDIILFQTKSLFGKIQRFVTNSEYDHIGLLIKDFNGKMYYLESSSKCGVIAISWKDFCNSEQMSDHKVFYRRLVCFRSTKMLETMFEYVRKLQGCKYSLSFAKIFSLIFKKKSSDNTFFCSELVAVLYKITGLLPSNTNASSYIPKHFASSYNIPLLNGAHLLPEQEIVFG